MVSPFIPVGVGRTRDVVPYDAVSTLPLLLWQSNLGVGSSDRRVSWWPYPRPVEKPGDGMCTALGSLCTQPDMRWTARFESGDKSMSIVAFRQPDVQVVRELCCGKPVPPQSEGSKLSVHGGTFR